jgi:tetratricopeptide (TPR) repeat protein
VDAGPTDLGPAEKLGRTYLSVGEFGRAADIFRQLIEFRPRHTRYYSLLGAAFRGGGRLAESVNVLERAVSLEPRAVTHLLNLSVTYFELGWFAKAEQVLLEAEKIDTYDGGVYLNLGVVYWHEGDTARAEEMFSRASAFASRTQSVDNNEANMLLLGGNSREALKTYSRAARDGGLNGTVAFNLAQMYLAMGRRKEAKERLDDALRASPGRTDALIARAGLAEQSGDTKDAERYYRAILALDAGNVAALSRLVDILMKKETYGEAVEYVKKARDRSPGDRGLRLLVPRIYTAMGWHEEAIMEYEQMLGEKAYASDPECNRGLATSYYQLVSEKKDTGYDRTLAALKKSAALEPSDPEIYLMIGDVYERFMGQQAAGRQYLEKALNLTTDPKRRKAIQAMIAEAAR